MKKKNIVAKRRLARAILIGAVLLSKSGERFGGIVQASTLPSTAWSQHYGGYYTDEKAYSVVQTSDGGYALARALLPSQATQNHTPTAATICT